MKAISRAVGLCAFACAALVGGTSKDVHAQIGVGFYEIYLGPRSMLIDTLVVLPGTNSAYTVEHWALSSRYISASAVDTPR